MVLNTSIVGLWSSELDSRISCSKKFYHQQLVVAFSEELGKLLGLLDSMHQRAILQAKDGNISSWLSILPLARNQFDLSAQVFRDSLALCHRKPLLSLPSVCDGCRALFSVEHSLDCCFGAWSLIGKMRSGMHLVTLLLWFGHQLLRASCV